MPSPHGRTARIAPLVAGLALLGVALAPTASAARPDARVMARAVAPILEQSAFAPTWQVPDGIGLDDPRAVSEQKESARRRAGRNTGESSEPVEAPEPSESDESAPSDTLVVGTLNQPGVARGPGGPVPPDTTGAIGPTRYVEVTNGEVAVYDRANLGQVGPSMLFRNFAGRPAPEFVVDPQIMWDSSTSRFYAVGVQRSFSTSGPSGTEPVLDFLNVMWSKTSDPTDLVNGWCRVRFPTDDFGGAGEADDHYYFDDYPKLGDNATHLVIGVNVFEHDKTNGRAFNVTQPRPFRGSRIWTLPKPAAGTSCPGSLPATAFGAPTNITSSRYPDRDGSFAFTPVPTIGVDGAATGYVVASDNPATGASRQDVNVWTVDPAGTVALAGADVNVGSFGVPANVPQPNPGLGTLDALDARLYQAFATNDPDVGGPAIWTAHTIFGGAGAMVRGYELLPGAALPRQSFSFLGAGDGLYVFNGVIAPATNGRSAVANFNTGSDTSRVDIRVRARPAGAPLNSFEPSLVIGTSPAFSGTPAGCDDAATMGFDPCRWGDYSGLSPDPENGEVVWGSNQLQGPAGNTDWTTRNFAVRANSLPSVSLSASTATAPTGTPVSFAATASDPDGTIASIALDLDGDGSFETAGASGTRAYTTPGTYTVRAQALDDRGDAGLASVQVTITNRAPAVSLTASPAATAVNRPVTLTAAASDPDGTITGFAFDLNGANTFTSGVGATPTTTTRFGSPGTQAPRVRATDDRGAAAIGQTTVVVRRFAVTGSVPSKQKLKTVRKKGLRAVATCPDGCTLRADLVLDGKSAKKLKINRRSKATVIGGATATLLAGRARTLAVKPSKRFAKRLKQIKGLRLSVKLSASDAFFNRDAETLGVKLRAK